MMAKSVRVHDDTHRALKRLKAKQRSASMDQVIREMIRKISGYVEASDGEDRKSEDLTDFLDD